MHTLKSLNIDDSKKRKLLFLCGAFFLVMMLLISLISVSFAALSATESIDILSEKVNYENKEQGSWKIKKAANWLSKGKVKVTYNIDTKAMIKSEGIDLLLVVNTANSLSDEQFSVMRSNLNAFSDSVLKDGSSSRMALLSFNSTYSIVSDFTDDKTTITTGINDLAMASGSSYYKGFQGINEILSNYQQSGKNKLVVVFLTNALPNKDMPNEKAQYDYLKSKYPDLAINAIAYEIGSFVPDKIKDVSDNQFSATGDTLNSTLNNASGAREVYKKFTIDDYIDTDNFSMDNLDSLKATYGKVSLDSDSTGKKVSINLDNLVSGEAVEISYEMNLNDDKIAAGGLFSVNKNINVKSTIDEVTEDVVNTKTPVVADNYKVSYDSNVPDGCSINTTLPSSTRYSVFDTVKITDDLVCSGYQFRGWKVASDKEITMVNSNSFLMPNADVVIKGTWSKLSINKSMDGTVFTPQTLNDIIENQAVLDNIKSEYVTADTGIDFSESSSDTNGKGVYTMASTKDDKFPIHYYRGEVTNNNVKYAGYCWKIVRTTETGGVKLIYNGDVDSETGGCSGSSPYIGKSYFNNSYDSMIDVGYMYGERYVGISKSTEYTWYGLNGKSLVDGSRDWYSAIGKARFSRTGVATTSSGSAKVYFGTGFNYNESTKMYTLTGAARDYLGLLHQNATGKYTCNSTSSTSCSSLSYVVSTSVGQYSYISLDDGETLDSLKEAADNVKWLYGKSVTYDEGTDTYTLNDTIESNHSALVSSAIINEYPYSCFSDSNTCTEVNYFVSINSSKSEHVVMSKGETYDSLYANATSDQYTYVYGNDVSYDASTGMYTLSDPISSHFIDWNNDRGDIASNHHYFCENNQTSCSTVNYIYYWGMSNKFEYWSLSGGKTALNVYNELQVNENDSQIKTTIDDWYSSNLVKYTSYLEDTVWCNDRSFSSSSGFDKDKSVLYSKPEFNGLEDYKFSNLSCKNSSDKFSVGSSLGNGKLTYPIGLLTAKEGALAGNGGYSYLYFGNTYWLLTPSSHDYIYSYNVSINAVELRSYQYIRPSISLKNGLMVYAGNGTADNPYVLENLARRITIQGNNDIKPSTDIALPGETIELISSTGRYKINSFDLNGQTISGSQFTMPDTDALITNISVERIPDAIYESEHNPYPSSMNKKVYADQTFEGASSLTVTIDYETQKTAIAPDYIYIYDGNGNDISGKLKGSRTTQTFTIPGNHIKITFTSDAVLNNYYGFRAVVIANYD